MSVYCGHNPCMVRLYSQYGNGRWHPGYAPLPLLLPLGAPPPAWQNSGVQISAKT